MAKQTINTGTVANDATGDSIRAGAIKINSNFDELYSFISNGNINALPAITTLVVTPSGSSGYLFDQYPAGMNPTIYALSGTTIAFDLTSVTSSHPFLIQTSGSVNYNTGLIHIAADGTRTTGSSAQSKTSGTLYWKIPFGITGSYKYQCLYHASMNGVITIKDISAI